MGNVQCKKSAVAIFLEIKCTKCTDTNGHNVLISTGCVLVRYSFQDIQYEPIP